MKAYLVRERDEFCATVVFAETAGKARALALYTEACEGAEFVNIEVRREPSADKYYKPGKQWLDWFNAEDRIALVKDCGFTCDRDAHCEAECVDCPAKGFCNDYLEPMERLTYFENGHWRLNFDGCQYSAEFVDRLAAYENTGLTPESVEALNLSAMGKAVAEIREFDGVSVERLRELAEADKNGRVVVLP